MLYVNYIIINWKKVGVLKNTVKLRRIARERGEGDREREREERGDFKRYKPI